MAGTLGKVFLKGLPEPVVENGPMEDLELTSVTPYPGCKVIFFNVLKPWFTTVFGR